MDQPQVTLRGQLLLDSGTIRESIFERSVVLICHHDGGGAFGLVINRSTRKEVESFVSSSEAIHQSIRKHILYLGGPLNPESIKYLYSDTFATRTQGAVLQNLHVGHSMEDLVRLAESPSPSRVMRIFAGYSGWSPGQLDAELADGRWFTHPASLDLVFSSEPEKLWKSILSRKDWRHRLVAMAPKDVRLN